MDVLESTPRGRLVLSPQEALVAGGPAEYFEQQVQALLKSGRRHLVVHLRGVPHIDSAGVRALIRSHTTSHRLGATFQLTAPTPEVRALLENVGLTSIFDVQETLDAARQPRRNLGTVPLVLAGAAIAIILTWAGEFWPAIHQEGSGPPLFHPVINVGKLAAAGAIGLLVINVQRRLRHDRLHTQTIEHAMVLLCMAGCPRHAPRRRLGRPRVRHRRRRQRRPLPHADRRPERNHRPLPPHGPRHGYRHRLARLRGPRRRASCASSSSVWIAMPASGRAA